VRSERTFVAQSANLRSGPKSTSCPGLANVS
jgi:hypothetical protein